MKYPTISDAVIYIGADDKTIDLFESQYQVPNGVSYNSYLILDEKVAVMDTVDRRATDAWFDNLESARGGREIDYLIISHLEPDHAANIQALCERFPNMQVVSNPKTFSMLPQFFTMEFSSRAVVVKEGETLSLGRHTLQFFMAPMVHWPEVMVTYEQSEKILFSADGFGKFGALILSPTMFISLPSMILAITILLLVIVLTQDKYKGILLKRKTCPVTGHHTNWRDSRSAALYVL